MRVREQLLRSQYVLDRRNLWIYTAGIKPSRGGSCGNHGFCVARSNRS